MSVVAPYCGQNQQTVIPVPARIAYKYIDREEGPWGMMPYAQLYPHDVRPLQPRNGRSIQVSE